jgi:hypothetical protein
LPESRRHGCVLDTSELNYRRVGRRQRVLNTRERRLECRMASDGLLNDHIQVRVWGEWEQLCYKSENGVEDTVTTEVALREGRGRGETDREWGQGRIKRSGGSQCPVLAYICRKFYSLAG